MTVTLHALYNWRGLTGLDVRFNIRCPTILAPGNPYQIAVRVGDIAYIRYALVSGETNLSAVTVHGDSLAHVRIPLLLLVHG
jgi:hypothetical protein